jgi:uncharacterized protein (UPF0548 family)
MTELRLFTHPDIRAELAGLRKRDVNFDFESDGPYTRAQGWRIDHYRKSLLSEPPGPPLPNGTWEVAQRLSESYEFVDPAIVRAFYDPREPFEGRTILLEIHFWGLRIYAGVRVGDLEDEVRTQDGREARVRTWSYRTLEDHFEVGQIDYELWKWLDSGEIEFRIDAFSRAAPISQPIVRLGFRLFGRRTQVRFARNACERMARLTFAARQGESVGDPVPAVAPDLAIRPQPFKETFVERWVRWFRDGMLSRKS